MTTATPVKIAKAIAIKLFLAANWKDVEAWPDEKLVTKLHDLPEVLEEGDLDGDDAEVLRAALAEVTEAAKTEGCVFELTEPEVTEGTPGADEGKGDKKSTEAAKANKPAKKKRMTWERSTVAVLKEIGLDVDFTDEHGAKICAVKGVEADEKNVAKAVSYLPYLAELIADYNEAAVEEAADETAAAE